MAGRPRGGAADDAAPAPGMSRDGAETVFRIAKSSDAALPQNFSI
jgi:hypothetical protein